MNWKDINTSVCNRTVFCAHSSNINNEMRYFYHLPCLPIAPILYTNTQICENKYVCNMALAPFAFFYLLALVPFESAAHECPGLRKKRSEKITLSEHCFRALYFPSSNIVHTKQTWCSYGYHLCFTLKWTLNIVAAYNKAWMQQHIYSVCSSKTVFFARTFLTCTHSHTHTRNYMYEFATYIGIVRCADCTCITYGAHCTEATGSGALYQYGCIIQIDSSLDIATALRA